MSTSFDHKALIERPDGSTIHYDRLPPEKQIEHDVVSLLCAKAWDFNSDLVDFKKTAFSQMYAAKRMMFEKYGITKGGDVGNITMRSACGKMMIKISVSKQTAFGPELEAAKALITQFLDAELDKGGSDAIRQIIEKVFKVNANKRIDTAGILGLRDHKFEDPIWLKAMDAIDAAIITDASATYVNFYQIDTSEKDKGQATKRIPLDIAKV